MGIRRRYAVLYLYVGRGLKQFAAFVHTCTRVTFFTSLSDLWAVVNNAGIWSWGQVEWVQMKEYKRLAEVNLYGTIRVTQAFLPLIRGSKGIAVDGGLWDRISLGHRWQMGGGGGSVKARRWEWNGHVPRMEDGCHCVTASTWCPEGRREV